MAQNALLGNPISLISKKNIRYEGILYSIDQANSTVALQNVRSFGTEGREQLEQPPSPFVAPQDAVLPFLTFRGQDIKDLHVHESTPPPAATPAPQPAEAAPAVPPTPPPPSSIPVPDPPMPPKDTKPTETTQSADKPGAPEKKGEKPTKPAGQQGPPKNQGRGGAANTRRPKKPNNSTNQVGTGASLLNLRVRGTVTGDQGPETSKEDFDFQSKLAEFELTDDDKESDGVVAYEKDDFFDSISCDALDRQNGVDNRLRGSQERNLNTETFGAVALHTQRRRRGGRGGGRGRGYYNGGRGGEGGFGGRGGGRGRGRGRGRGGGRGRGRGRGGRFNNNGPNGNSAAPPAVAASS
eukprot:Nitzschia sp. Nitz4//scaffold165_size50357//14640//15927//NITZ4_007017-RA/size50357-augustus-gene-0.22-mRNA-1//1//CDS//3329538120//9131//frame0